MYKLKIKKLLIKMKTIPIQVFHWMHQFTENTDFVTVKTSII